MQANSDDDRENPFFQQTLSVNNMPHPDKFVIDHGIGELSLSTPQPVICCSPSSANPPADFRELQKQPTAVTPLGVVVFDDDVNHDMEARVQTMNGVVIVNLPVLVQFVPLAVGDDIYPITVRLHQFQKRVTDSPIGERHEDMWYCEVVAPLDVAFLGYESWASRRFWARLTGAHNVSIRFWNSMYDVLKSISSEFKVPMWIPYTHKVVLVRMKRAEFEVNLHLNTAARPQLMLDADEIEVNIPDAPPKDSADEVHMQYKKTKNAIGIMIKRVYESYADSDEKQAMDDALKMSTTGAPESASYRLSTLMLSHSILREHSEYYSRPLSTFADIYKIDRDFDALFETARQSKPLDSECAMAYINTIVEKKIEPLKSQITQVSQQLAIVANTLTSIHTMMTSGTQKLSGDIFSPTTAPSVYFRPVPPQRTTRKRHNTTDGPSDRYKLDEKEKELTEYKRIYTENADRMAALQQQNDQLREYTNSMTSGITNDLGADANFNINELIYSGQLE